MTGSSSEIYQRPAREASSTMLAWQRLPLQLDARGWQNATLLALLAALQFACIIFTPLNIVDGDTYWGAVGMAAIGSALAPPALLALWAVFGPGRLSIRLPLTMWLAAAFYIAILFAVSLEEQHASSDTCIVLTCWLLAFAYLQLPLWLIRALRRWRFVQTSLPNPPATGRIVINCRERPGNQFTVRSLLGWMLAAAVPLAAVRALMPATSIDAADLFDSMPDVVLGGLVVALAGLTIVPLTWILLAAGRRPVLRCMLSLLLLAGLTGGVWLFIYVEGSLEFPAVISILAGTIANGVISLLVVGACGYRLDRISKSCLTEADLPGGSTLVARKPLSRYRFALALAPLSTAAVVLIFEVPYQLRQWRQAAITSEWGRSGVGVVFNDDGKLSNVHGVDAALMSDDLLHRIAQLKDLDYLCVAGSNISDRQLALLAPLTNLRGLVLCDCDITDAGLDQLARFKTLEVLDLGNTRVTDAGLAKLQRLPNLQSLNLEVTDVTDDGLAALAHLPRLNSLDVSLTAVNAAAAKRFSAACPNVSLNYGASDALLAQRLVTHNTFETIDSGGVTRAIAINRRPVKRLHAQGKYSLLGTAMNVTDAGLKPLAEHTELEELDLHDTGVTDQGLRELAKLTSLKKLDLRGTQVTEQGIAGLYESLPKCEIVR